MTPRAFAGCLLDITCLHDSRAFTPQEEATPHFTSLLLPQLERDGSPTPSGHIWEGTYHDELRICWRRRLYNPRQ